MESKEMNKEMSETLEKVFIKSIGYNVIINDDNWNGYQNVITYDDYIVFCINNEELKVIDDKWNISKECLFLKQLVSKFYFSENLKRKHENTLEVKIDVSDLNENSKDYDFKCNELIQEKSKNLILNNNYDIELIRNYDVKNNDKIIKKIYVYKKC